MATHEFLYNLRRAGYTVWQGKKGTGWDGIKMLRTQDGKTLIVEQHSPRWASYILSPSSNYNEIIEPCYSGVRECDWQINFQIPNEIDGYDYEAILKGYLGCALWTDHCNDESNLDSKYSVDDFLQTSVEQSKNDILWFMFHAYPWLHETGLDDESIGHNLWLTRGGHGTGFWDRGLGYKGDKLSDICKEMFGNKDAMETDNGKVEII